MSTKRYVDTAFWRDSYVVTLTPEQKHIFNYLLNNPATTLCGIYELPKKIMAFETGYELSVIDSLLEKLIKDGKIVYVNGWIILINRPKHQPIGNIDSPTYKAIERELKALPTEVLNALDDGVCMGYIGGMQGVWGILKLKLKPKLNKQADTKTIETHGFKLPLKAKKKNRGRGGDTFDPSVFEGRK